MKKAAFEDLTKELRDLVLMTILCYGKHRGRLRQVNGYTRLFNGVTKCARAYDIEKEAYVVANAVMDGVIALCDAGRVPDFDKETTSDTRRAVALMIQLTSERLNIVHCSAIDVQSTVLRFKNLEDELRIACFNSFIFGDIEVVIRSLRNYTHT